MANPPQHVEMTFWDHLEDLRWVLVRSLIAIASFSLIAFLNKKFIFDNIFLAPKEPWFFTNRVFCKLGEILQTPSLCMDNSKMQIININLAGQFTTHMTMAFALGIFVSSPYIIYEFWRFIKPALHTNERNNSRGAVVISSLLFIVGVLFAYYLIVPLTINFLGNYQVSEQVTNSITLNSYLSSIISLCVAMGVVFEIPILVYFLTKIGILSPVFMKKSRKIVFIILLIVAAIITPSTDIFSLILVLIPLLILYEASIMVSERVYRKKMA